MDHAGNQESKPAAYSSLFSNVENIWRDANFPHPSLAHALPTSDQVMVQLDNLEVLALPSSHYVTADVEFHNHSEALALPPSSSVLDQTPLVHAINPFAMQMGCSSSGSPVAHSNMHAMHVTMHIPYPLSTMEGSSLSGSGAAHALCRSNFDATFSSGYDAAHVTRSTNACLSKSLPSRVEFMQSFVNTLLPELKKIHSQSPPISLKEKHSAVRLAADMSLAISAGGHNTWSQALFQKLATSSGSNVGVRRKNNVRKSNTLRSRIYASILRRSSLRGGSHAMRQRPQSHTSHSKGSSSFAYFSISRGGSPSTLGLSGSCVRRMRHVGSKRRSGLISYVKILRNSRASKSVKSPAVLCKEASRAVYAPSISKEHIASLGSLVPGGCNMDVPLLFQEAADYILSLQMQVEALQSLSHFVP